MDEKWLEKLTNTPLAPPEAPRQSQKRMESETANEQQAKFDNLTLQLANAVVDMSKALCFPMHQFKRGN